MNKYIIYSIVVLMCAFSFQSCDKGTFDKALYDCEGENICRKGNSVMGSQLFELPANIESIIWNSGVDLTIVKGNENSVRIESEENLLDLFNFSNYNKEARLDFDQCFCSNQTIKALLTVKNLRQLTIAGDGDVAFEEEFKASSLKLICTGNNSLYLNADIEAFVLEKESNKDFLIEGKIDRANIEIIGVGNYNAVGCISDSVNITSLGKGSANISVRKHLEANILGPGEVCYKGRPTIDLAKDSKGVLSRCNF